MACKLCHSEEGEGWRYCVECQHYLVRQTGLGVIELNLLSPYIDKELPIVEAFRQAHVRNDVQHFVDKEWIRNEL